MTGNTYLRLFPEWVEYFRLVDVTSEYTRLVPNVRGTFDTCRHRYQCHDLDVLSHFILRSSSRPQFVMWQVQKTEMAVIGCELTVIVAAADLGAIAARNYSRYD